MSVRISRIIVHLVERRLEADTLLEPPHCVVVAAAALDGCADASDDALQMLAEMGGALGETLVMRALAALRDNGLTGEIQGYGKAGLAGPRVPLECIAALLHPRLGHAVRARLPGASSIMPSVTRRGGPGACVDIPLHGVADMWSFDHFDTVSLVVPDAPADDEALIAVALADRGRPLARIRPS